MMSLQNKLFASLYCPSGPYCIRCWLSDPQTTCVSDALGPTQYRLYTVHKDLERTQKIFTKKVLGENYYIFSEACKIFLLEIIEESRKKNTFDFAKQFICIGKMLELLSKKKHFYNVDTIKPKYYKVNHAKTKIYQNSPIITMQKLSNQEIKYLKMHCDFQPNSLIFNCFAHK